MCIIYLSHHAYIPHLSQTLSQTSGKNLDTCMHIAASHGFDEIAAKLVDSGADLEAKNVDSMTPLHSAARMGREKMMNLLIARSVLRVHRIY